MGLFPGAIDCFNEIKGYRYLADQGYEEVRFVAEQRNRQTPDLRAWSGDSAVVMEVKTVNESTKQKNYFEIPGERRMALDSEKELSDSLKKKIVESIARGRRQLLAMQEPPVMRRIIYLVIRPDFNVHVEDELSRFLEGQTTPEVEIVHCLLV